MEGEEDEGTVETEATGEDEAGDDAEANLTEKVHFYFSKSVLVNILVKICFQFKLCYVIENH